MLREEMERRSSNRLDEAKALYLARSELLTAKSELMTLRAENIILREKLKEANITDIPSPGNDQVTENLGFSFYPLNEHYHSDSALYS